LAVLHTDPMSALTPIGYAYAKGDATFGRYTSLDLLDATTLALIAEIPRTNDPRLNWTLDDSMGRGHRNSSRGVEVQLRPVPAVRTHLARRGPNPVAVTWRLRRLR
jgi:hypothetical protein